MPSEGLTLLQLTTVSGVAIVTALLSQVFWNTIAVAAAVKDRYGSIVALVIGIIVAVVSSLVLGFGGQDLAQAVVNGLVGGLAAIGIHDTLKPITS